MDKYTKMAEDWLDWIVFQFPENGYASLASLLRQVAEEQIETDASAVRAACDACGGTGAVRSVIDTYPDEQGHTRNRVESRGVRKLRSCYGKYPRPKRGEQQ